MDQYYPITLMTTATATAITAATAKLTINETPLETLKSSFVVRASETATDPIENPDNVTFPEWLPTWDPDHTFDAYPDNYNKSFSDKGLLADPNLTNLFPKDGEESVQVKRLTPKFGSEVRGIQLSQLSDAAKNDLALFVAQRGVVAFRDQDFKTKGIQFARDFGSYFGPLHIHPATGAPKGAPDFHIVYHKPNVEESFKGDFSKIPDNKLSFRTWHTDITFEEYPSGTTFFVELDSPDAGGDTLFSDATEAYKRLSPKVQDFVSGLKAVHTFDQFLQFVKVTGKPLRKPAPADVLHPLVRIHPVTEEKSLFVPQGFVKKIEGLKDEESDAVLKLLFDHVNNSQDLQVRVHYEPGTVVVWDNRRVLHSAVVDVEPEKTRHFYRITPLAERPVLSKEELEEWNRQK